MTLVRWDPLRDMAALSERINRAFSDDRAFLGGNGAYGAWMPAVDIFERDDNVILRAELPGMNREDIDVSIENGLLTLHGERRREAEFDEGHAHRLERVHGSFTRTFVLPATVDASGVAASYKDGVLEVVLPKSEASKPKKVQIQAA
jgi:HSP20 family protein